MTAEGVRLLLKRKGYRPAEIAAALARLGKLGYVDDLRYAAAFVATVAASKSWGPARVRQELARRGVDSAVIGAALAKAAEEGHSPADNLDRALARALRARGIPKDAKDRARLRAYLARQGFAASDIVRALAALSGRGDDEDDAFAGPDEDDEEGNE